MAADWLVPQCSAMKNEEHEKKCLEHAGAARGEHTIGTAFHTILGGTLVLIIVRT